MSGTPETRVVLRFTDSLAPFTCAILPLLRKDPLISLSKQIFGNLLTQQHRTQSTSTFSTTALRLDYDETGSIGTFILVNSYLLHSGRRYRRQDEIGTPYCVTVDFDTLSDNSVTVRYRDTMKQIRVPINSIREVLTQKSEKSTWPEYYFDYLNFTSLI